MTEEKDRTAPDVERVIAGLEYCMGGCQVSCFDCPYREIGQPSPDCLDNCGILNDAIELLKKQEPRVLTPEEAEHAEVVWFESRNSLIVEPMFTRGKSFSDETASWFQYGRNWRCWSARPTDEQRRAVKWDE